MKPKTVWRAKKKLHPFQRHIATSEENKRDEFFELNHGQIIANKGGNPRGSGGGWGK